jgi:glutathione peroxidase
MIDRRYLLLGTALGALAPRIAQATAMSRVTAYAFNFKGLDGTDILLASYAGHSILVVNTASLCGYTPQYTGLQALWTRYRAKGLMVLGVPSNDFGSQEPGGASEIEKTAQGDYHVTFPLTEKVAVKGKEPPPVLQMGGAGAPAGGPALELPQISDRPRRPPEGGVRLRRGTQRSAPDRGHRAGVGRGIGASKLLPAGHIPASPSQIR